MARMIACEKCGAIVVPQEARNIQGFYYKSNLETYSDTNQNVDLCRYCYEEIFCMEDD
nr:hypothetical protein [uncultured Eisenbergiella sp.]